MDYINMTDVSKRLRGRNVLDGITLTIPQGIIAGFTGINGSGKSMLFRAIAGLIRIDSGSITIAGTPLTRSKPYPVNLGLLLDATGYWDHLSASRNLELLASIRKLIGPKDITAALTRVGLDPNDTRPTSAYSMGMKQRLSIAQAIMEHSELVILDEPTNALDKKGIALICDIIGELKDRGTTVLVSCHNQPQVEELFDMHVSMYEGTIESVEVCHETA